MKRNKLLKSLSLLFAAALVAGNIAVLPAKAGSSDIIIDNSSFKEEIDVGTWNSPNSDIEVKDGVLVFPENATDMTALIGKNNAKISEKHDVLVSADVEMQITKMGKGKKFAIAFGLASIEAMMGEPGNVELVFENKGGLTASVVAYDDNGDAKVIVKPASCGSLGSNLSIKAVISTKQTIDVTINGKKIGSGKLPITGEGRFGFLQNGECAAKVSKVNVVSHEYDCPENVNIVEDFEDGYMNTNALTHFVFNKNANYAPSRCFVDEMDGNKVFRFQNAGDMYFGTLYKYSNFELKFDVIGWQREDILDEEGNMLSPKNAHVCVSFGGEAADYTDYGYVQSTDLLIFDSPSRLVSFNTNKVADLGSMGYNFTDADCKKDFSVKVTMIDSWVTIGFKWLEEKEYKEVFKYQPSTKTPTGTVQLWTASNLANFSIDNFSIKNLDEDPNLIEVEDGKFVIETPADFDYQPLEYVYRPASNDEGFNLYYIIAIVAGVCVIALALTVLLKKVKANKANKKATVEAGKENDENEKE